MHRLAFSRASQRVATLKTVGSVRTFHSDGYNKTLSFHLNGKKVAFPKGVEPDVPLIDVLRHDPDNGQHLTGTKLTCGEGGCGACTVTLSHYDPAAKKVVHRAVNSCLVPAAYAQGMAVTTVEGLGSARLNRMHAIQERMVAFGGSQCGFCTPGFVMSIHTGLQNNPQPDSKTLMKCLDGNLCRCTAYRPIIDTVKSFCADTKDTVKPPANQALAPYDPAKDPAFPAELKAAPVTPFHLAGSRSQWFAPTSLKDILQLKAEHPHAKIVAGLTEVGIDLRFKHAHIPVLISPVHVPELNKVTFTDNSLEIGSAATLTQLYELFKSKLEQFAADPKSSHKAATMKAFCDQLHWFSGTQIRNVASVGGNIMNASPISDLNPVFLALNAEFVLRSASGSRTVPAKDFFVGYKKTNCKGTEILETVRVPLGQPGDYIEAFKQSRRREDDIAIVTACLRVRLDSAGAVKEAKLAYGGMAPVTKLATETEQFLLGKQFNEDTFNKACEVMRRELHLPANVPGGMPEYRLSLALGFFYKLFVSVTAQRSPRAVTPEVASAMHKLYEPSVPRGSQEYDVPRRGTSVGDAAPHMSGLKQATGEAIYTDDIPRHAGEVQGALVMSKHAHARIKNVDPSEALKVPGVLGYYGHKDIPGKNLWGHILLDEELFASEYVLHYGQPIGVVVAENDFIAKRAASLVKVDYEPLPALISMEDAIEAQSFYPQVHGLSDGDVKKGFAEADHVIEGTVRMGGQEHFYFETHQSVAVPSEDNVLIWSSTQEASKTQKTVAAALGIPANRVVVSVARIGGGFGGKESRSMNFSAYAAVAARHLNRPVRVTLDRDVDMLITGGRHPFRADYKVGFTKDGLIKAGDFHLYNNAGLSMDLSIAVMDRALLHLDGCYKIPHFNAIGHLCKTHMPSNTAFRGFGSPQGHFLVEVWIEHIAKHLKQPVEKIRELNLYNDGEVTYYQQKIPKSIRRSWAECKRTSDFEARRASVEAFNGANRWRKRGIVLQPAKYGIAFGSLFLNQGSAYVHVYTDGSVLVTHGGVEMGQGLNTKVCQVVATELGVPLSDVHTREMATDKIANASATAASMGSDIYGEAALNACKQIAERLAPYRAADPSLSFKDIVMKAYMERVNLSAHGFFKSEHKGWNWMTNKGEPWRYFTLGTVCTEVEIDQLTGDYKVLRSDLVMDIGLSINPTVDIGQIEGAFLQGQGWCTIEELVWGDKDHPWVQPAGRLATNGPGAYKIPTADDIPLDWRITLMKDVPDSKTEHIAVHSSKAVGEPPLLMGMSVYTALKDAIYAARRQEGLDGFFQVDSPLTSERIRMACADRFTRLAVGDDQRAANFAAKGSF